MPRWELKRPSGRQAIPTITRWLETINGLYKAELIHARNAWPSVTQVEFETTMWVHWWKTTRIHENLGYKTPKEYETEYYEHSVSQPAHA